MSSSELNSAFELAPSGTLSGNSNATFAGTFTWSGGYMRGGTGKMILTNCSVLAITSGNYTFFNHSVDLYTTNASWNNGLLYSGGGATFTIKPGAIFDVLADVTAPYSFVG